MSRSPEALPAACAPVRESLSARLDDEQPPLPAAELDRHLAACSACTAHAHALARVHRSARVAAADAVPDLTADILVAITEQQRSGATRRTRELRWLVGLAGAVQLVLALPVLLGVVGPDIHAGRDLGALQLAIGVGLLLAAWQPWRAAGVLPIVAVVAAVTVIAVAVDTAAGAASFPGELVHISELVGVAALWALCRRDPVGTSVQARAVVGAP